METWEEFKRRSDSIQSITYACKCGHRMVIPANVDKLICKWCGNWVYRNKKDEFKDKLGKELKKNENN